MKLINIVRQHHIPVQMNDVPLMHPSSAKPVGASSHSLNVVRDGSSVRGIHPTRYVETQYNGALSSLIYVYAVCLVTDFSWRSVQLSKLSRHLWRRKCIVIQVFFLHYSDKSPRKLPHFKFKSSSSSESGSSLFAEGRQTARHFSENSQQCLPPENTTSQNFYQKNQEKDLVVSSDYGKA